MMFQLGGDEAQLLCGNLRHTHERSACDRLQDGAE
jgi:hypothetical protein